MTELEKLSFMKRAELFLLGLTMVKTSKGILYIWKCPKHGIQESYKLHGYDQRLECSKCLEESINERA
jgi:hypothetical protein